MTNFTTAKKLAKTLLTSIIMSPITLSTAVITLSSVDNIVAMEDSKSIKTDVDLNNGIGEIVSETINDNIKAKANLLKEQKILDDENQYWAKQAIESKNKYSSSIYNLKKLFVLAKEHNEDVHNKFNIMFAEAIGTLIKENGNKINCSNEARIFALLNGLTIYNSLYTIYNYYLYSENTRSLNKGELDLFFMKTFNNAVRNGLKYMHINTNNNLYQIIENFIVNKYKSENINFRKVDCFADKNTNILVGFLKHDWDCYLTQFGVINDIEKPLKEFEVKGNTFKVTPIGIGSTEYLVTAKNSVIKQVTKLSNNTKNDTKFCQKRSTTKSKKLYENNYEQITSVRGNIDELNKISKRSNKSKLNTNSSKIKGIEENGFNLLDAPSIVYPITNKKPERPKISAKMNTTGYKPQVTPGYVNESKMRNDDKNNSVNYADEDIKNSERCEKNGNNTKYLQNLQGEDFFTELNRFYAEEKINLSMNEN